MAAEHDGVDALMAALSDDPLPEGALTDADFMAEHWAAAADVALLREQLGLIGDALASQERTEAETGAEKGKTGEKTRAVRKPAPARIPVRERRYWRPLRTVALGVAAVTAAGAMVTGSVWLLSQAGRGTEDAASSKAGDSAQSASTGPESDEGAKDAGASGALAHPGYLACARLVVEGTVTAVTPVRGADQDRITLRVTRYYKPDQGPAEVTYVLDRDVDPRAAVGDHTLVAVERGAESPDTLITDEREIAAERASVTAALPESRSLTCE
ncbi:hypothetical protein ACH4TV_05400 [Streptomyces sp. NPDC020898]|uniref:hypothetical protein n=1 Tax=Streptomyces sp. NPDC020898 TaxID=3365101 RepID=UPI0037B872EA